MDDKNITINFSYDGDDNYKKFKLNSIQYTAFLDWLYSDSKSVIKLTDLGGHECHVLKNNITYIREY